MQIRFRTQNPLRLALLGCLLAAYPTYAFDLPPATVSQGFGVNIHFTDPQPGEMDRFGEARFGVARMDFAWEAVEKTPGVYDFSAYDRLLATLASVGTRPLFILDYGNRLYDQGPPRKPAARAAFARFSAAAVRHFAGRNVIWEIWNEPNGDGFWPPKSNPTEYAAMAVEAAKAIRAADPKSTLIAPGASGFPWEYLENVFKSGLLQYLDGVSVHPYRGGAPESAASDWARLRGLIGRYAPEGKRQMPMISSEWGYSTQQGGDISEEKQGQYIVREWLSNLASGVDLSIYYDWKEDGTDPKENEHHFGTVRPDYAPKPAFTNARLLIATLRGYTFRHRLLGKTDADWQLLFQRGDTSDLALVTWNASESAPTADQTPSIRKPVKEDEDYVSLYRLASVRYKEGPRAISSDAGAPTTLQIVNTSAQAAHVTVALKPESFSSAFGVTLNTRIDTERDVPAGKSRDDLFYIPAPPVRAPVSICQAQVTWNGEPLPPLYPITLERIDPLTIRVAPWRGKLRVMLDNPAGVALDGKATLYGGLQQKGNAVPIHLSKGQTIGFTSLPFPAADLPFHVAIQQVDSNRLIMETPQQRLRMMTGFGNAVGKSNFFRTDFVQNVAQATKPPLAVVKTDAADASAPADTALSFPYQFTPGWFYAEVTPDVAMAASLAKMSAGTTALALWIRDDGSENALRARLRDATGQYFQPDLGRLDKKGWRLITIPLNRDGLSKEAHWGGANDGVPHYPLAWDSLLLVDSTHQTMPVSGEILIAAPYYVVQPAK